MNNKEKKLEVLTLYKNYLYAIEVYREYGEIYGDTKELIKMYEEKLKKFNIKPINRQ